VGTRGGAAPAVSGGPSYTAVTAVPPLPSALGPTSAAESTINWYFNLIPPDGPPGLGHFNQFVPQLMLGETLCGSANSSSGAYQPGACETPDPLQFWVAQSQYFYALAAEWDANATAHVLLGETVAVFPGERVLTNFTLTADGAWLLEMSVLPSSPPPPPRRGAAAAPRGPTASRVRATAPYMDASLSWLDPAFNRAVRAGACMEVYGMARRADYPATATMDVTMPAASDDWVFVETPTCASAPQGSTVATHGRTTRFTVA
jgi:hypothetical protein